MELSWTSFLLEIINFLVLIWILKYFFYAPLQKTIFERKKIEEDKLENAEKLRNEAGQLQLKYENRLADWQQEKDKLQKEFLQTMDTWKAEHVVNFEKQLKEEQEKSNLHDQKKRDELIEKNAKESLLLAGKFVGKLLRSFADEHLEQQIIEKTIEYINHYPADQLPLMDSIGEKDAAIVQSAKKINKSQQQRLIKSIEKWMGQKITVNCIENPDLLAGLTIQIGSGILQANLRDELKFFTEIKNELA